MKYTEHNDPSQNLKKRILSGLVALSMLVSLVQPLVYATVIDGGGNTLSGSNSNSVNLSNSGVYTVDVALNGTLDAGDTVLLTAMDGSGNTLTGSLVSASGGESTGSVILDFSGSGLEE
jgi:hypothetical protein